MDFLDVVHHRNKTVAVLKRFKGLNDVIVCTGKLVEVAFGQCRLFALSQASCPSLMSRTRRGRFICYYCNAHVPILMYQCSCTNAHVPIQKKSSIKFQD